MDQLLVALDVDDAAKAMRLADALRGAVGGFKIGSQLFTSEGPSIVRRLTERGDRVFLDLKFHDIPNTVAGAVAAATQMGVWMVNVHASGGAAMMRAAAATARDTAASCGRPPPIVVAVTVLTSLADVELADIGATASAGAQVERLARLTRDAGLDGVVASPREIAIVRRACGPAFTIVTPGIRESGSLTDDQRRTMSAGEAIRSGASYVVVGRPITGAADPRAAAQRLAAGVDA